MKRISILLCFLFVVLSFTGCDTTDDPDKVINIGCYRHYVGTTESWYVNSHNDYRAFEVNEEYDKETDTYTVVLKFKKLLEHY